MGVSGESEDGVRLPLSRVAAMLGCPRPVADATISGWSIDSRTAEAGDLFVALRGERHDGHSFVSEMLQRGAAAALVDHALPGAALVVRDTQRALEELGRQVRLSWGGVVVGVTGSAGKTTTKDVIAALLAVEFPAGKTVGNLNNHIGVPLSILRLPDEARVAVLEMGMNHAGEIRHLCGIARPDFGVVTNVGYAHIEYFDGIEGIALAKRELVECLSPAGIAVLNNDDSRVRLFSHSGKVIRFGFTEGSQVRAQDVELLADGANFRVDGVRFHTSFTGRHGILNLLAGIAVAREMGIALSRLVDPVRALVPGKMRGERTMRDGVLVLNDCYNSNPDAARAMLDVLRDTPARRRIAVLGEMLELGPWTGPLHRDIGEYAARGGIDVLLGIRGAATEMIAAARSAGMGADAACFFPEPMEAGRALRAMVHAGDAVLFKGSRGTRVEQALQAYWGEGAAS